MRQQPAWTVSRKVLSNKHSHALWKAGQHLSLHIVCQPLSMQIKSFSLIRVKSLELEYTNISHTLTIYTTKSRIEIKTNREYINLSKMPYRTPYEEAFI